MFKTLYARLAAVLLGLFCLIGVFYVLLTLFTTQMHLQEVNQKLNRILAQHLVSEKVLLRNGRVNDAALRDIFHMLMVVNPVIEVYLLDTSGAILAVAHMHPLSGCTCQQIQGRAPARGLSDLAPTDS